MTIYDVSVTSYDVIDHGLRPPVGEILSKTANLHPDQHSASPSPDPYHPHLQLETPRSAVETYTYTVSDVLPDRSFFVHCNRFHHSESTGESSHNIKNCPPTTSFIPAFLLPRVFKNMNALQLVISTILLLTTSIPVSSGAVVRLR